MSHFLRPAILLPVNVDAERSALGAGRLLGLTLAGVLAGVLAGGIGVRSSARAEEPKEEAWGKESHGLVLRIMPVDPAMNEKEVAMKSWGKKYSTTGNATFAVEFKNVSDKTIPLLGVRAKGGELRSSRFGPQLFDFEITYADGRPLGEAFRRFTIDSQHMLIDSIMPEELKPNESLKLLLRPSQFMRSTDYRFPPGKYRVKANYRGLRREIVEKIRKAVPADPRLSAWAHEISSNTVDVWVAPDKNYHEPHLMWGPKKDGLQAAIEFISRPEAGIPTSEPGVLVGSSLQAMYHVKNVGDKTITFVSESPRQGDNVHVTDAGGRDVEVRSPFFTGWPIDIRFHLKPGDVVRLPVLQPAISVLDQPGKYMVHYTIRFNSRVLNDKDGNKIFPAPGDWQTELDTGKTPLFLRNKPIKISANGEIHGRLLEAETGKPIQGGRVTCRPLYRETGKGGGADAVTDSAGYYRLQPPGPGIYNVWLKKLPRSSRAVAVVDDGIVVEAGKVSTSQLLTTHGRYLMGTVFDEDGKPMENFVVHCYSAGRRHDDPVQRIRTKTDGTFIFYVPPGRTFVYTVQDGGRSIGREGIALFEVPADTKSVDPISLTLAPKKSNFAADDWLKRTTPGSKVTKRDTKDVTGKVVDFKDNPLSGASVFTDGGIMVTTDDQGEFRVQAGQGMQLTLHAFQAGHRVWYGKPTAGEHLKIVLEEK